MAFHVEISSGFRHHARAFNLDEATLRQTILDPWVRGRAIELGDREWEPKDCKLKILEGPELAETDLAMGRGWSNAERISENVTRRLVDAAAAPAPRSVAVLAESPGGESELLVMLDRLGVDPVPWSDLRASILRSGAGTGFAVVLAVESANPPATWLFDAGLARGALGAGAVIVQLGDGAIPAQLAG
ncbi:MAG: hypothetical protein ACJ75Z_10385, partial [Solirubrobacterales bacterium]